MIKINVFIDNKIWKSKFKNPESYLKRYIKKLENFEYFKKKNIEFSILLTGNQNIKKLNNKFRGKNRATDVLSFPFFKKEILKKIIKKRINIYVGDIVINFNKIKDNKKYNFYSELNKLWIHGLVHLFGFKHYKITDYKKMNVLEKKILNHINK